MNFADLSIENTWESWERPRLKANGEDVKVVQESMRHADSRITLLGVKRNSTKKEKTHKKRSKRDAGRNQNELQFEIR